ncbi:hypothetical protein KG112_03595 [Nocardioides sp. zg-ZUI104]|uniref:WXG100 family type VII secretion target n=1 Tax=Nocardioides faecalis TaxID=2803858 RepID=UPI001BCC431C|nr:hypothetical protein [Nocardioides faecalis]MBS4751891.1 hypothetical protein [Nocardioides faecalis]
MGEGFYVEEAHVAGYGEMADEVHGQLIRCLVHNHEARPTQGYTGLMSVLSGPLDTYVSSIHERVAPLSTLVGKLRNELVAAAWDYHGTDRSVYEEFHRNPLIPSDGHVTIKDFPSAVAYSAGTEPVLEAPEHEDPPIAALVDEVGGSINVIDWVIEHVAGFSPVEKIVEPLSGNWAELERAAEVLTQVGDGYEQCAANLTAQLGRLGAHWNGGAALTFEDHTTRLGEAIAIEGPINRLVGYVLTEIAGEIEAAAEFMVSSLKTAVDKIGKTVATAWVPGVGWYRVYDTARTVIDVFLEAKELVESIEEAIEQVEAVLEAVNDPVGFATDKAREVLGPYLDGAQVAGDLAQLDPSALTDAPDTAYDVGDAPRRAG